MRAMTSLSTTVGMPVLWRTMADRSTGVGQSKNVAERMVVWDSTTPPILTPDAIRNHALLDAKPFDEVGDRVGDADRVGRVKSALAPS